MTDKRLELSRRKILAGAGTIGVAGAGLGLGTSALYSDQEGFANNSITAGTLDMVVDWEEHYSFPQIYGIQDPATELDVTRDPPQDPENYTAFPPGVEATEDDPILWVHNDDVGAYMDNTAIDAFPDADDDGAQDEFDDANACSELVNVGEGAGGLSNTARTQNQATSLGDPLIQLGDVKPGDFGEVTLSFHLCNNPGYVWINADNVSAAENGVTEPEGDSPAEDGDGESTDPADVELLDEIQTALWYDNNCDNLTQAGEEGAAGAADIAFLFDRSTSMDDDRNTLQSEIETVTDNLTSLDTQFALIPYEEGLNGEADGDPCGTFTATPLTSDPNDLDFSYAGCGGTENASEAIIHALDDLSWRGDATKILVVLTDEDDDNNDTERETALDRIDDENACLIAVSNGGPNDNDLEQMADEVNCGAWTDLGDGLTEETIIDIANLIGQVAGGEEIFFTGSLRDALTELTSGGGIALDGDGGNDFDEFNDPEDAENRGCYQPSPETHCVGFSWWVPVETGNQIQSDSVGFDLGFYTEQCRNNSGVFGNA